MSLKGGCLCPCPFEKCVREDARAFLEVHHGAVRELAADDYPLDVIGAWAPLPITPDMLISSVQPLIASFDWSRS